LVFFYLISNPQTNIVQTHQIPIHIRFFHHLLCPTIATPCPGTQPPPAEGVELLCDDVFSEGPRRTASPISLTLSLPRHFERIASREKMKFEHIFYSCSDR
jgi:hypothetical protein